jgi:hypothetical protein
MQPLREKEESTPCWAMRMLRMYKSHASAHRAFMIDNGYLQHVTVQPPWLVSDKLS